MLQDSKRQTRMEASGMEAARVGQALREARMSLGLSLEDMSQRLRINMRYMAALEEGRPEDLPGTAYGAGFVRSYAEAMGLDAPDLVRRFREAAGAPQQGRELIFPEPVPDRGVPTGLLILLGALLAGGGYFAWYQWSGAGLRTVDAVPDLPPRLEETARQAGQPPLPRPQVPPGGGGVAPAPSAPPLAAAPPVSVPPLAVAPVAPPPQGAPAVPSGAPPAEPPAAPAPPAPTGTPIGAPAGPAAGAETRATPAPNAVVLRAEQECWVQIRDPRSGRILLSRLLQPGETFEVPPEPPGLLLNTGRIEALAIQVGGVASAATQGLTGVRRDVALDAERLRAAPPGQLPFR